MSALCTRVELTPGAAEGGAGGRVEAEAGGGGSAPRPAPVSSDGARRGEESLHQPPLLLSVLLPARACNVATCDVALRSSSKHTCQMKFLHINVAVYGVLLSRPG